MALLLESYRLDHFNRAYVSPFSELRFVLNEQWQMWHELSEAISYISANYWPPFSGLHQVHSECLSKIIYRKLKIIGSHLTVGAPWERDMLAGVR